MSGRIKINKLTSIYRSDIVAIVESLRPDSVVIVTAQGEDLVAEMGHKFPQLQLTQIPADEVAGLSIGAQSSGLAIVANALEYMEKQTAQSIIARLRDLFSGILLVAVPIGQEWHDLRSNWDASELLALGLHLVKSYTYESKPLHLYQFDIQNYKLTPDWLNSRNWANPEMWDKARW